MRRLVALRLLLFDRSTTAGSVLGVVAIIFLVGQQLSVLFGLLSYMSVLVDHSSADLWVLTKNTQNAGASGSLPVSYVDRIGGLAEVEWVEPMVSTAGLFRLKDGRYQGVQVVGLVRPQITGGPWQFAEGSIDVLLDLEGITIDRTDLGTLGEPELLSFSEINRKRVRVGGLTQSIRGFEGTLVFTNIDKARQIGGVAPDRCSTILVKLRPGSDPGRAAAAIAELVPKAEVVPTRELSRRTRAYYLTNTGIGASFGFSTLIGTMVGTIIIMLTMYTTVLNRKKEIAVLRALGARKRDILVFIFYQSLMIGAVGLVLGFLLLAFFLYFTHGSQLPSYMPLWVPPVHAAFTLLLCLLGSLLAMRKATSIDPASAFR